MLYRQKDSRGIVKDKESLRYSPEFGSDADSKFHAAWTHPSERDLRSSEPAVIHAAKTWINTASAPGVRIYTQLDGDSVKSGVWLDADADDSVISKLIARQPKLNAATWNFDIRFPLTTGRYIYKYEYQSVGYVPQSASRRAWQKIVDEVGEYDEASARTQIPPKHATVPTVVTIKVGSYHGQPANYVNRLATALAPILADLPGPALLDLQSHPPPKMGQPDRTVRVTIGGCSVTTPADPLEEELRARYEQC